jgi:lantibiotic modifying enzyme
MNNFLLQISQLLQKQNFGGNNHGLLNGNTGIAIFLYHLSRAYQKPEFEEVADSLLDKAFASLTTTAPPDFENGLAGIGWGIEYLVQNGFAEGNTDEILEEVDTKVFKILTEDSLTSFETTNGLTGYLLYLISRLKNSNDLRSMAYRINKELLIQTINKLDELVTRQFPMIVKEQFFDLFWRFPVMLYALAESYHLNIYNRKIEQIVKHWMTYCEAYIPSLHINRLYLALALSRLNSIFHNKRIEKQIQILFFATNFDGMATEFDPNHDSIRFGWPGVVWLLHQASKSTPLDYPNYQFIIETHSRLKTKFNEMDKKLLQNQISVASLQNPGISGGITGVGLMDLLWPEVFNKQQQNRR